MTPCTKIEGPVALTGRGGSTRLRRIDGSQLRSRFLPPSSTGPDLGGPGRGPNLGPSYGHQRGCPSGTHPEAELILAFADDDAAAYASKVPGWLRPSAPGASRSWWWNSMNLSAMASHAQVKQEMVNPAASPPPAEELALSLPHTSTTHFPVRRTD
jgi:hypothetical protein